MQNVFEFNVGAFTGNGSFKLALDVEYYVEDGKPCHHAIPLDDHRFVVHVVLAVPADDGSMANVCLLCAKEAAGNVSKGMLPAFKL